MEEQKQNLVDFNSVLSDGHLNEESPEEQARIDALIAHNSAEDIVDLGNIDDLAKLDEKALTPKSIETADNQNVVMAKNKLLLIKKIAQNLKDSATQLVELLTIVAEDEVNIKTIQASENKTPVSKPADDKENVVEGIFDGEKMVGPDGKTYDVPVNYASKSRLVEGDLLKLIITASGTFLFKQIQPVERRRVIGALEETETGEFYVLADDRRWRVLNASVSYFKGETGDEAVIMVPRDSFSRWGAVENIIKR